MDLYELDNELCAMSKCNPVYQIKLAQFSKELVNARDLQQITQEDYENLYEKYFIVADNILDYFSLYCIFIESGFIPNNFYLSKFLRSRSHMYDLYDKLKRFDGSFQNTFPILMKQINIEMESKKESFWDSFLLLLLCIYTNNALIYDNALSILKIIKYAAEWEGNLLDTVSKQKMKVFSDIPDEVGKDNASKFHFIKALLTDRSSLCTVLNGLCINTSQNACKYLFNKNHAEACIEIRAKDAINLCLNDYELCEKYLWVFSDLIAEMQQYIENLLITINDDHLYNLVLSVLLHDGKIDSKVINSVADLEEIYALLDSFSVIYFGKDEIKKVFLTKEHVKYRTNQ